MFDDASECSPCFVTEPKNLNDFRFCQTEYFSWVRQKCFSQRWLRFQTPNYFLRNILDHWTGWFTAKNTGFGQLYDDSESLVPL